MMLYDLIDGNVVKFIDYFVIFFIGKIFFLVFLFCNLFRNLKIIKILFNDNVCDSLGL